MGARTIGSAQIGHFQGSKSRHRPIPSSDLQQSLHDRSLWKRPQSYGLDSQGAAREQKRTSLGTNIVRVRKRA